ncbi:MAG: single-stranded DNA-binding protein [Alistipes sp.]|nr:single-stranded DNA-binding protein [Alistipes sp.]
MVNKVILVGNVGIDPEVRSLENGTKVARVRLATTERIFDRQANETKEHTEWHTVTLWRGLADIVDRYVHKGSQIYVEGRLRTREWTDKDGNKRYTTEILADSMNLLGRRGDNNAAPAGGAGYGQPQGAGPNYGGAPQGGGYGGSQGAPAQGSSAAPQYGAQPAAASQPAQAPAAPSVPAEDPDDLPF